MVEIWGGFQNLSFLAAHKELPNEVVGDWNFGRVNLPIDIGKVFVFLVHFDRPVGQVGFFPLRHLG